MPQNITPLNKFTSPIVVPLDGDPVSFAQREPSLQALADQSLWNQGKTAAARAQALTSWGLHRVTHPSQTAIAYAPELGIFVAMGTSGLVMTSPDGETWTESTMGAGNRGWTAVCWSSALALFVAVGTSGGSPRVATSADGTTWTAPGATPENNAWRSVCFSPTLTLFVAVSSDGTNRVMTSPNGTTWTAQAAAQANSWRSVCWSPSLALFVAVSSDGTNRVMTSANGTAWTVQTAAEANQWQSVCWSADLALFVAVSLDGTHRVMTSPNGTAWTVQTAPSSAWAFVIWIDALTAFVAVGANALMSSTDGITWTATLSATVLRASWAGIAWSYRAGCAVACGPSVSMRGPELRGAVGTIVESTVDFLNAPVGSWVTGTFKNITSIAIPGPGEWEIDAMSTWLSGGTAIDIETGISLTSGVFGIGTIGFPGWGRIVDVNSDGNGLAHRVGAPLTLVTGVAVTVYLVSKITFPSGTPLAGGYIRARRIS